MQDDVPSDTAFLVARGVLLASKDERLRRLLADGEAAIVERMLDEAHRDRWVDWMIERRWLRPVLLQLEKWVLPGLVVHFVLRKRCIERAVRDAIAGGVSQVVVIAAGFDTLAWRLHEEFPEVHFIEIDHPATQKVKLRAFGGAGNFHLEPVDLSQKLLKDALAECPGFSADRSTAFVAEGLTMYLSEKHVSILMRGMAGLTGPVGKVIFTFMERGEDGSIAFRGQSRFVASWLKWRSEPFLWGISRDELPEFLHRNDLGQSVVLDENDLRERYLVPHGIDGIRLARGECICLCSSTKR